MEIYVSANNPDLTAHGEPIVNVNIVSYAHSYRCALRPRMHTKGTPWVSGLFITGSE
ncbi:hypothetical protein Rhe02_41630 [Rhizocola hellebori]|uniref:Uncharacterized protein n=1 Tax=Rhizocola hellebori TaxID=1392758 RepID=A0A8J3QAI0_9ACTN|nr:hypothetical protein Rhe02_41630 [Rhizocola hellebori]